MIHAFLDDGIGNIQTITLCRHDSGLPREAVQGMVIEDRLALGDTRPPGGDIARLGRTGDPQAVAGRADLLVNLGPILGIGSTTPAPAGESGLMAMPALSCPTMASCDSGSMRDATLVAKSRCSTVSVSWVCAATTRARAIRQMATSTRMPITMLNVLTKCVSCLLTN